MIKTTKNADGTWNAEVDGFSLGLHCIFRWSARSVALSYVARKKAEAKVYRIRINGSEYLPGEYATKAEVWIAAQSCQHWGEFSIREDDKGVCVLKWWRAYEEVPAKGHPGKVDQVWELKKWGGMLTGWVGTGAKAVNPGCGKKLVPLHLY